MNSVDAIRSVSEIKRIKAAMITNHDNFYFLLFTIGINTGLRISDILHLKFSDVLDNRHRMKSFFFVQEQKTSKFKKVMMNKNMKEALKMFLESTQREKGFIFSKRKGQPVNRSNVWRMLNKYANDAGVKAKIGTHTLRKTFGYHLYKKGVDISRIQYLLNHSSPRETLRYIGITQEEVDNIVVELNL